MLHGKRVGQSEKALNGIGVRPNSQHFFINFIHLIKLINYMQVKTLLSHDIDRDHMFFF